MEANLFEACRLGDTSSLQSLLSQDPLLLDRVALNSAENPLHISAMTAQTEITKQLLSRKPNWAMELNQQGFSPLHMAAANGHVEIVRELLLRADAAGPNACLLKGRGGKVAPHCAAIKGKVAALREMISACPELLSQVTVGGETPLHLAIKNNQFEAVGVLVEELQKRGRVEIINWKDNQGNSALHLATLNKQQETLELLIGDHAIANGLIVNVNSTNSSGFTPRDVLDLILQSGSIEQNDYKMIETFQKAGALKSKDLIQSVEDDQGHDHDDQEPYRETNTTTTTATFAFSRLIMNLWTELTREIGESSIETQSALMVVAVLIATMTYQAILSPPSGFWSTESGKYLSQNGGVFSRRGIAVGEAVMGSDPHVFATFTVFNAIGFFASLGMISLLTSGFPLRAWLRLSILSMAATYVIAVFYEAPTKMKTVFVVLCLMGVVVVLEFGRFVVWLLRKCGLFTISRTTVTRRRRRRRRRSDHVDGNQLGV